LQNKTLALNGGKPVRDTYLPYGHQWVDEKDIKAVNEVLRSDWLTTGPKIAEFEEAFAAKVGAKYAVAVSSGTAALHAAAFACGIKENDEVITTPLTFAASANCILYQKAKPVFADIEATTLLLDPDEVEAKITERTKAIIAVDYAGQPCDYDKLNELAQKYNLTLIADACHALGAKYKERPAGSLADLNVFSFHPVKPITTAEGGMITTNDADLAQKMRRFRNHGFTSEAKEREEKGSWFYEMVCLGFNYRLSDLNAALGISQLKRLDENLARRQKIASFYDRALEDIEGIIPLQRYPEREHAWHLYVVKVDGTKINGGRDKIFPALRAENIGVNVHYIPVYRHPFYENLGYKKGLCPKAEKAYEEILTLPLFAGMTERDAKDVVRALAKVCSAYAYRKLNQ